MEFQKNNTDYQAINYLTERISKLEASVDELTESLNKCITQIEIIKTRFAVGASLGGAIIVGILQLYFNK